MASLVTCLTTRILMTLVACDLCLAWSIASDENHVYRHSNWWDLKNDYKSNQESGVLSEGLFKKVKFYQWFKKQIEQLEVKYEDDIGRIIENTMIKYSIECFLHSSRACLKADWLRAQRLIEISDQNEESRESDIENYTEEKIIDEVTREIRNKLHENKNNLTKRGPMISVDQSLHAVNKGSLVRSSASDRQESSLSRLDVLGR